MPVTLENSSWALGDFVVKTVSVSVILLSFSVAGCASTQLNYNTLEIASTVASLETKQALANISAIIDDPDVVPAQVTIGSGSIGTTNSVTPSIVESLTKSNALLGAASATRTAVQSATQAGTNQSTQSWAVAPVNDGDDLARLRALYLFAATGDVRALKSYPRHKIFYAIQPLKPANEPYLDPVLEDRRHRVSASNPRLCSDWLYYSGKSWDGRERPVPAGEVAVALGLYGEHELYTTQSARSRQCLSEFILFVQDAVGATASPSGAAGSAKSPKSGIGAPLSAPYSGPLFTPDSVPPAAR